MVDLVAYGEPFSTPDVVVWDLLRAFCALGSIAVIVGGLIQLFTPLPGIVPEVQRARAVHIVGMMLLVLAFTVGNVNRLGYVPATPAALVFESVGIAVLLTWLAFERRGRKVSGDSQAAG